MHDNVSLNIITTLVDTSQCADRVKQCSQQEYTCLSPHHVVPSIHPCSICSANPAVLKIVTTNIGNKETRNRKRKRGIRKHKNRTSWLL